jgi:hypothetical protein
VHRREDALPDQEDHDHGDQAQSESHGGDHDGLGEDHPRTPWDSRQGGADLARGVFAGDHQDAERPGRDLRHLHPGRDGRGRVEGGGVGRRPGRPEPGIEHADHDGPMPSENRPARCRATSWRPATSITSSTRQRGRRLLSAGAIRWW